jgi:hypothetical protein
VDAEGPVAIVVDTKFAAIMQRYLVHITSGMLFIVFSFRCLGGLHRSAIAISDLLEASVHLLVPEPGFGNPHTP